jgi:hypothetical protein
MTATMESVNATTLPTPPSDRNPPFSIILGGRADRKI